MIAFDIQFLNLLIHHLDRDGIVIGLIELLTREEPSFTFVSEQRI